MTSFNPLDANDVGRADAHEPTVAQLSELPHDEASDILRERTREQELQAERLQEDGDGTYLGDRLMNATNHLHDSEITEQPATEGPGLLDQVGQFGQDMWQQAAEFAEHPIDNTQHFIEEHAGQLVDEVQPEQ